MRPYPDNRFIVEAEKCIRCGECVSDCPVNMLVIGDEPPAVAAGRERDCIGCQHCLAVCPTGAVSVLGLQAADSLKLDGNPVPYRQMERLVKGRRSVRRYLDENIDPALITQILEIAGHAPSGRNERRLQFSVVDDREVMNQVRHRTMDLLAASINGDSLPSGYRFFKSIVNGWQAYQADTIFRWAPHLLVASAARESAAPEQDAIIALSYFEIVCQSAGIGTLWNGMVKMTMTLVPELREMLGVPRDHQIGFAMSFGKPAVHYARTVQHNHGLIQRVKPLHTQTDPLSDPQITAAGAK